MVLFVVSGFLGAGKTTFIINLAKAALEKGLKVAVLVNEIGEAGIDDQFMKRLGFNVLEILGGCICCTLTADLVENLQKVRALYSPDIVIVEPSGAADPGNLIEILNAHSADFLGGPRKIALLDPLRMHMLMEVIEPLITSTLKQADLIIINKADMASSEQIELSRRVSSGTNQAAAIRVISAKNDSGAIIYSELLSWRK